MQNSLFTHSPPHPPVFLSSPPPFLPLVTEEFLYSGSIWCFSSSFLTWDSAGVPGIQQYLGPHTPFPTSSPLWLHSPGFSNSFPGPVHYLFSCQYPSSCFFPGCFCLLHPVPCPSDFPTRISFTPFLTQLTIQHYLPAMIQKWERRRCSALHLPHEKPLWHHGSPHAPSCVSPPCLRLCCFLCWRIPSSPLCWVNYFKNQLRHKGCLP